MHACLCAVSVLALSLCGFEPATLSELIKAAEQALRDGKAEQALKLADEAVKGNPKSADCYFLRGSIFESTRKHEEAIKDFDKSIALDPRGADAYNHRGSEHLKRGDFDLAIKDFDKFLEFRPEAEPGHWRRGIAYYYAGKYELGRKQFEAYEKVDKNDVENVVWQYLCIAKASGVEKARLAIKEKRPRDRRLPLVTVYDVFCGSTPVEGVFRIARQLDPTPEQLTERLFYANLYVGLFYYSVGDKKSALECLDKAADDYKIGHYMWDIALVHRKLIRKELER